MNKKVASRTTPAAARTPTREVAIKATDGLEALPETTGFEGMVPIEGRAACLWLSRVSTPNAKDAFGVQAEQTIQLGRAIPAVRAIEQVGLRPLSEKSFTVTDDDGTRHEVEVIQLRCGKTRAVFFWFGGHYHLWCLASAAKEDDEFFNGFMSIAVAVIRLITPIRIETTSISRLIRSHHQYGIFQTVIKGRVDLIRADDRLFDLRPEAMGEGFLQLQAAANETAGERILLVRRLTSGRVIHARRNQWVIAPEYVPFGWSFDARTSLLKVDPSKRAQVREMLLLLQSGSPASYVASELDRLGVPTRRPDKYTGVCKKWIELKDPSDSVRRLMSWASMWVNGECLFRFKSALPGMSEFAGAEVSRYKKVENDPGEVQLLLKFDLPEDGWAEPEVLQGFREAALAMSDDLLARGFAPERPLLKSVRKKSEDPKLLAHCLRSERGPAGGIRVGAREAASSRGRVSAMVGRSWSDGEYYYELGSGNGYQVRRWPLSSLPQGAVARDQALDRKGRANRRDGGIGSTASETRIVAFISRDQLMARFPQALIEAIRSAVPVDRRPARSVFGEGAAVAEGWQDKVKRTKKEIKALRRKAAGAREMAADARAEGTREEYEAYSSDARRHMRKIEGLELRIEEWRAEGEAAEQQPAEESFDVMAQVWVPAMKTLAAASGVLDQGERRALRALVPSFRMEVVDGQWFGVATVRINTVDGVAELGPIRWPVRTSVKRGLQMAQLSGPTPPPVRRRTFEIQRALEQAGLTNKAASVAANAPFPQIAAVLLHRLAGEELPEWVGARWRDPRFVDHLVTTYADPDWAWAQGLHLVSSPLRSYLAALALRDGAFRLGDLPRAVRGYRLERITHLTVVRARRAARPFQPTLVVAKAGRPVKDVVLGPVLCRCDSSSTYFARCPEVLSDMLCTCGLMPNAENFGVDPDLLFPEEYLRLAVPMEASLRVLEQQLQESTGSGLSGLPLEVLRAVAQDEGLTATDYGITLRQSTTVARTPLLILEGLGYLTRSEGMPRRWRLSDAGRAVLAEVDGGS